jgi:UDP-glucose 4-epimerase
VTGGSGFIGTWVVGELLNRGYDPVVFDPHGHTKVRQADVIMGDVRDATAVTELAAHVDGIIHLAAVLGTQETIGNPRPAAETNLIGSLNVMEACAQYQLPMTYIAVGNANMANGTYVLTKTVAENFARMFAEYRGLKVNSVRVMNAYGPGQLACAPFGPGKVRKITPAFICRALCGLPIELYGTGDQVSDMVWVGDAATVLVNALEHAAQGDVWPVTVEVGPEHSLTVRQVAEAVIAACVERGYPEVPINLLPMRAGERTEGIANAALTDEVMRLIEHRTTSVEELWRLRQWVKPLHNQVRADPTTLRLAGVEPSSLTSLEFGIARTVEHFIATRGVQWHDPDPTATVIGGGAA